MKLIKNRIWATLTSLLLAICFLFGACVTPQDNSGGGDSSNSAPTETYCTIALVENPNCEGLGVSQKVVKGEDATFTFTIKNGYTFNRVDYETYDVEVSAPNEMGERTVTLTLHEVKYSGVVDVKTKAAPKVVQVKINPSEYFRLEREESYVTTGNSVDFTLYFQENYTFQSIDYEGEYVTYGVDSAANENHERKVGITLKNVGAALTLNVTAKPWNGGGDETPIAGAEISYHLNGGEFISGIDYEKYTIAYKLSKHIHPNTSIGTDIVTRDGYVLIGWNTELDGSGTHIGLGSKAPIVKGERLTLYAEWERWTDASSFEYGVIDVEDMKTYSEKYNELAMEKRMDLSDLIPLQGDGTSVAIITKYVGEDVEKLVIPEKIAGYDVIGVDTEAVTGKENLTTVVLPKTIQAIERYAFDGCENLRELYLYDNVDHVRAEAFGDVSSISTMHLNAVEMPIFGLTEVGQVANKLELLRNHDGKRPKVVIFGSCSTFYGVNAREIKEAFPAYDVFNMGVVGGTCALYQIDLIKKTLNEGDVFVHITELGAKYQWFGSVDTCLRLFGTLESNYDYLAELDLRRYSKVMQALNEYFTTKKTYMEVDHMVGTYDDFPDYMSLEGDLLTERNGNYNNGTLGYELPALREFTVVDEFTKKDPFTFMKEVYQEIKALTGNNVLFGFGPMNADDFNWNTVYDVENLFHTQAQEKEVPVKFLTAIDDGILSNEYFFDSNYHLSTEGASIYTQKLIECLGSFYKNETLKTNEV